MISWKCTLKHMHCLGFWLLSRYIRKNNQLVSGLRNRQKKQNHIKYLCGDFCHVSHISCLVKKKRKCNYQVFLFDCYYFRGIVYMLKIFLHTFLFKQLLDHWHWQYHIHWHLFSYCMLQYFMLTIQKYHLLWNTILIFI